MKKQKFGLVVDWKSIRVVDGDVVVPARVGNSKTPYFVGSLRIPFGPEVTKIAEKYFGLKVVE